MALELLHGPNQVTFPGGTARLTTTTRLIWHDDLGVVGTVFVAAQSAIVQLDGSAYARGDVGPPAGMLTQNIKSGGLAFRDIGGAVFYETIDMRVLFPIGATLSDANGASDWTVLCGRYIRAFNGAISTLVGTTDTAEATLSGSAAAGSGWITEGREGKVYVAFDDGNIYGYDVTTKAEVGAVRRIPVGDSIIGLFYSRRFGVFISVHEDSLSPFDQQVKVWADEVRPSTLSNPVALDTIEAGHVSRVRVQVLGDLADAVEGLIVEWSIAGSATLESTQSLTDSDGYALNKVIVPVGAGGNVTIDADIFF